MNCPVDGMTLVMSERSGIEIDYCPTCRGVWLDRGELDKIVDRSLGDPVRDTGTRVPAQASPVMQYHDRGERQSADHYGRKRKKENWLSELFD